MGIEKEGGMGVGGRGIGSRREEGKGKEDMKDRGICMVGKVYFFLFRRQ